MKRQDAKTPSSRSSRGNEALKFPGWQWLKLRDVCDQDRKIVEPGSPETASLPYLSLEHIESNTGRILRDSGEAMSDEGKSTTFAFDERHVLYGKLRPYLNKVALPDYRGRCTTELIPLLPKPDIATREFLAGLLRRTETVAVAMQDKTGSRMPRADMDSLMALLVPIPPLAEQRRIAALLREQLAEVAQARTAIEAQLGAAQALPSAHLRAVFDSPAAQRWPRRRLGDVLTLRKEVVHPRNNPRGPAIFVGLEHTESHTGRRIGSLPLEMSELTGRKPRFYQGDIVYGYLRPYLNKVWLAEFDGLCSVDQYVYEVNQEEARTEFIAWFMRSPIYLKRAPIERQPGQLPRIRTEEVSAVEINLPPLVTQHETAERIQSEFVECTRLQNSLSEKLATLDQLPAALLRKAFEPNATYVHIATVK